MSTQLTQSTGLVSRVRVEQLYVLHYAGRFSDDQLVAHAGGFDPTIRRAIWQPLHELASGDQRQAGDPKLDALVRLYERLRDDSADGCREHI